MKDLRISFGILDHPKKIKLQRRCGNESFENLLRLWIFVAQTKPRGKLDGMDDEDIEIASGWNGESGFFTQSMIDVGFLILIDSVYHIKDWKDHNGYAYHAPERAEKARMAAEKRWGIDKFEKKAYATSNTKK